MSRLFSQVIGHIPPEMHYKLLKKIRWYGWRDFSINEGYDFRMKFPWINGCIAHTMGIFYISISFRNRVIRFSCKSRFAKKGPSITVHFVEYE